MALYPDIVNAAPAFDPFGQSQEFLTTISPYAGLGEIRKQRWLFPKRHVSLQYKPPASKDDARLIWQFHLDRKGSFESFNFIYPFTDIFVGEYVGVGDSSQLIWNLPFKLGSGVVIKVGSVVQTTPSNYVIDQEAGEDGADRLTFVTAPAEGALITADFTGYLKMRCRFAEDLLSWQLFLNRFFGAGIKLIGRPNR